MKVYRIKIHSWTSSFRFPNIISSYHPTLTVPPISTILGFINACAGSYLNFSDLKIGYYFEYESKSIDLETIYQMGNKINNKGLITNINPNVIKREFLYNCNLYLYLFDDSLIKYFENPFYQLLLGRSYDLASICEIQCLELTESEISDKIKGQIIPFVNFHLPGLIQALPVYFSDEIPRNNIGTQPFSVIDCHSIDLSINQNTIFDPSIGKNGVNVYIHEIKY
ncbi:MAG TPA: type I-B CRISPR-associated protein Cas5 [Bacteroidetes bacterium]|nr:type I-B CRISPR-associated protein Cas5 [Bacteroidota bacterium]